MSCSLIPACDIKIKPAKNSLQLKLQQAVLDSVKEIYPKNVIPLEPKQLAITELAIVDKFQHAHSLPCKLCGQNDPSKPSCIWLCCGYFACTGCAWLYYSATCQHGMCPYCAKIFPDGWSVHDVVQPPPVPIQDLSATHVNDLEKAITLKNNLPPPSFSRMRKISSN